MRRHECIKAVVEVLEAPDLVLADMLNVSTELANASDREGNLYLLQMGIPFALGLGLATALGRRQVVALGGDGSLLLNPGVMVEIGHIRLRNLLCVVFDNGRYEAVNHELPAASAEIADMARAAGVPQVLVATSPEEVQAGVRTAREAGEATFLVARIEPGPMAPVRPLKLYGEFESTCRFVRHIERTESIEIARPHQSVAKYPLIDS